MGVRLRFCAQKCGRGIYVSRGTQRSLNYEVRGLNGLRLDGVNSGSKVELFHVEPMRLEVRS